MGRKRSGFFLLHQTEERVRQQHGPADQSEDNGAAECRLRGEKEKAGRQRQQGEEQAGQSQGFRPSDAAAPDFAEQRGPADQNSEGEDKPFRQRAFLCLHVSRRRRQSLAIGSQLRAFDFKDMSGGFVRDAGDKQILHIGKRVRIAFSLIADVRRPEPRQLGCFFRQLRGNARPMKDRPPLLGHAFAEIQCPLALLPELPHASQSGESHCQPEREHQPEESFSRKNGHYAHRKSTLTGQWSEPWISS